MFQKLNTWLDGELFSYRRGYVLTHPKLFFEGLQDEINWGWQRLFRGYDDRVIWNLDRYIARMMIVWITRLKNEKISVPCSCFDEDAWDEDMQIKEGKEEIAIERWNNILDQISEGFSAWIETDEISWFDPKQKELKEKFDKGFDLFHKYFGDLWD